MAIERALTEVGVSYEPASSGVTVAGGTPAHRWLDVTLAGAPIGLKFLAATEREVEDELDHLAGMGLPRDLLGVVRPTGWPIEGLFGLRGLPIALLRPEARRE